MKKYSKDLELNDKKILEDLLDKFEKNEEYEPTEIEIGILEKYGLIEDIEEIDDIDDIECDCCDEENEEFEIDVCTELLNGHEPDLDKYKKGLNDASYYIGFIAGLKNVGYPTNLIHELILNGMNAKNNIEVAKQTVVNLEKQSV